MTDVKEISTRTIAAFNAGDAKALDALSSDKVVLYAPGPTGRAAHRGREAVKSYNEAWFGAFPGGKLVVQNQQISNDYITVEGTFEGVNTGVWKAEGTDMPATGKALKGHFCQVTKITDGLIESSNLYFDQLDVMTQLGLMPAPAAAAV